MILGHDKLVARWVANELGVGEWLHDVAAIGVMKDEVPVAGVVYYAYRWPAIEMACASTDARWLNKTFLGVFFGYPFVTLGCKRIVSLVDDDNFHARKFNEKLGFVQECTLTDAHPNGDAVMYGMLKSHCRWLNGFKGLKNNQGLRTERTGDGRRSVPVKFTGHICQRFSQSL